MAGLSFEERRAAVVARANDPAVARLEEMRREATRAGKTTEVNRLTQVIKKLRQGN